jgi:hypothetical protein
MSTRIKQSQAAEMMGVDQTTLTQKLFEWGDFLSFKIDREEIVVNDIRKFTDQIDQLFQSWNNGDISDASNKILNIDTFQIEKSTQILQKEKKNQKNQKKHEKTSKMDQRMETIEKNRESFKKNLPIRVEKPDYSFTASPSKFQQFLAKSQSKLVILITALFIGILIWVSIY